MSAKFSLVYPTRHRPEFVGHALRILEAQRHDSFEVIVSDNFIDPALSCEQICDASRLTNLKYVRPPSPVGMVENWNYALQFVTGGYICYLTDKMFVLPDALDHIERAIDSAGGAEITSWTSDAYNPESYADYFGAGRYFNLASDAGSGRYQRYSPAEELDRRGRAEVARGEQSPADYVRGKLVFGAYRRDLVERIVDRYGALFHNISPDYTSMIIGLTEARDAIELASSCVVSINTDISNGALADANDGVALAFLRSLDGGLEGIFVNMLVPGLYVSQHNLVAHDYLSLKRRFNLEFAFNEVNWLAYCWEDTFRPVRQWSDQRVETEQKELFRAFIDSLEPAMVSQLETRVAQRAARSTTRQPRFRGLRRLMPGRVAAPAGVPTPSIYAAILQTAGQ